MTDLRTLLSAEDKNMMNDYVTKFATDGSSSHASIDRLLRCWNDAKNEYLYTLLGNQFQIQKTLVYNKPENKLYDELSNKFNKYESACYKFRRNFDRFLWENRITLGEDYYKLQLMMDLNNLLHTEYNDDEFSVGTPDGRTIKVQKGCRPMRIISKVAKAYGGIADMEEFQNEVSVILTQKKLTGTMTLSIHPMDYMTMSHNDCGWTSCMDWTDGGCYRRGTIEMMNSNCVLVAYLAADNDMGFYAGGHEYHWNNKKWRELFIVTPEIITGVKGYPYQNSDLVKLVNSWIRELAIKNLGWNYDEKNVQYQHRSRFDYKHDNGETINVKIAFETNTMYNDFGTIDHYGIIGSGVMNHMDICTNYSGDEMCMMCGDIDCYFDGEGALMCEECDNPTYCHCCGERIDDGDTYELDGEIYCYDCYYDRVYTDVLDGEEHDSNNTTTLYLVRDNDDVSTIKDWYEMPHVYIYHTSGYYWNRMFNDEIRIANSDRWTRRYYVTPSMFKNIENLSTVFEDEAWEDYLPDLEDDLPDEDESLD